MSQYEYLLVPSNENGRRLLEKRTPITNAVPVNLDDLWRLTGRPDGFDGTIDHSEMIDLLAALGIEVYEPYQKAEIEEDDWYIKQREEEKSRARTSMSSGTDPDLPPKSIH